MSGLAAVLGDLLPSALGIALSPVPIIASVLMLLSSRAATTATAFVMGWVLGLTIVTVVVLVVTGPSGADTGSDSTVTYSIKLMIGLLFLALGLNTWRKRPREGHETPPPKWMAGLESIKPLSAFGLGAALSGLNPKNLALAIAGAIAIASGNLDTTATVVCVIVFVVLGSLLVAGPAVAYFAAPDAMTSPLNELRGFMEQHNAAIMTVLLGLLGLSNLGKGLGGLIG